MKWWYLLFFNVLIVIASPCMAQNSAEMQWASAQDAYLKGDFTSAASMFEKILAESPGMSSAMYNLGNCYLQSGNLGKAVLWYERARRLRPNDRDVLHNLAIAKARRSNPVVEIQEFFAMRWIRKMAGMFSASTWAVLSLVLFWVAVGSAAWAIRAGLLKERRWYVLVPGAIFLLTLWMGLQRLADLRRTDVAVVVPSEIAVSIAPDSLSKTVAKIGPGEKVIILDSLNAHYKVRLANYEHGWILQSRVEKI